MYKSGIYLKTFILISTLIIIFLVYKTSQFNFIEFDDIYIIRELSPDTILNKYFKSIYKAKFISNFIIIFFGYELPKMLNINLTIWMETGGALIKGIFWCITSYLLASAIYLYNKKNFLFPIIYVFTYIFLQLYYTSKAQNEIYAAFYCFVFPFIFYLLFWQKFIKLYTNNTSAQKKDNIELFIYGLLTGISAEITAISTFASLCIISVISIIKKYDIKLIKISFLSTILGNLIYFLHPVFWSNASSYGTLTGSISGTIKSAINILPEYLAGYKETFFKYFLNYIIIIILLSLLIYFFSNKNLRFKMISIAYSLLLGGFFFFTMLLFGGRPANHTAVVHYDVIIQMIILFLFVIYYELSCILYNKKAFYISLLVILFSLLYINCNNIITFIRCHNYSFEYLNFNNIERYREE